MLNIALIDVLETTVISFILSGVGWKVAAGYGFVRPGVLPGAVLLTTLLIGALLSFDRIDSFAGV